MNEDELEEAITNWCGTASVDDFRERKAAYWAWANSPHHPPTKKNK